MTNDKGVLKYISESEYNEVVSNLKNNESKQIYEDEKTIVEVYKKGKRIYTIIEKFGTKKLDEALNNICSLAV